MEHMILKTYCQTNSDISIIHTDCVNIKVFFKFKCHKSRKSCLFNFKCSQSLRVEDLENWFRGSGWRFLLKKVGVSEMGRVLLKIGISNI